MANDLGRDLEFKRIKASATFPSFYTDLLSALHNTGLINFLRKGAVPHLIYNQEAGALECARAAGYNEALDDILYFREKYLEEQKPATRKAPDYGGMSVLEEEGRLTVEELNAIRRGERPDYAAITKARGIQRPPNR